MFEIKLVNKNEAPNKNKAILRWKAVFLSKSIPRKSQSAKNTSKTQLIRYSPKFGFHNESAYKLGWKILVFCKKEKPETGFYFFLWRFLRRRLLRLCFAIFARLRFLPQGIGDPHEFGDVFIDCQYIALSWQLEIIQALF